MYLVVQIPVYNEAATLSTLVKKIHATLQESRCMNRFTLLIINDGSTDSSYKDSLHLQTEYSEIKIIHNPKRQGLGCVFQKGVQFAKEHQADIFVNIDGDGQFNPFDIPKLLKEIVDNEYDLVLASRFKDKSKQPHMPRLKNWGNQAFALLLSMLTAHRFYDVSCGFRAFSKRALSHLQPNAKFTYTHESILQCHAAGLLIKELPLEIQGIREHGKSKMASSLTSYGLRTSGIIIKTLFSTLRQRLSQKFSSTTSSQISSQFKR